MVRKFLFLSFLLLLIGCRAQSQYADKVRPAAVAGQFYPGDETKLRYAINAYLEQARSRLGPKPVGIVVPHAGYVYSAQIAADAFHQAVGHDYDLIVLLGANHTSGGFDGFSVYAGEGFKTPLGTAKVDQETARRLIEMDDRITFDASVHEREHSIEVELPFVQTLFHGVPILPIVVGRPDLMMCRTLGKALAKELHDKEVLLVASADLSHYPKYEDAVEVDNAVLEAVESFQPDRVAEVIDSQMRRGIANLSTCACGEGPILTAMVAARQLGATTATRLSYANSGMAIVGDKGRVVGYGAVAFFKEQPTADWLNHKMADPASTNPKTLSLEAKRELIDLARRTIIQYLKSETLPLPRSDNPELNRNQGAFVTINKNHRLRGCIGHMAEDQPLVMTVASMAIQAAFNDRRFSPLQETELDEIEVEISVLTPYERVSGPEEIEIGQDGVLIRKGSYSAVYLPQVAPEQGWGVAETLDHLCHKAGLDSDAWRTSEDMEFYTFQAIVFDERDVR